MFPASPLIRMDCPLLKRVFSLTCHVIFHSRLSVCASSLSLPPSVSLHSTRFAETLSYKVSVSALAFTLFIIAYTCGTPHCLILTAQPPQESICLMYVKQSVWFSPVQVITFDAWYIVTISVLNVIRRES